MVHIVNSINLKVFVAPSHNLKCSRLVRKKVDREDEN